MTKTIVELDGAQGEGGGQILRTALSLSMITGTPFAIRRIRAKRQKPGLLRQHLTAVQAAAEVCGAEVEGAEPGSQALRFSPGAIRAGAYRYAIGSAGSATLVLQTVLPALWFADGTSTVCVSGGTHNPAAPPVDFLQQAWLPLLRKMGVEMSLCLTRHGFYPAGGGEVQLEVKPVRQLRPLELPQHLPVQSLTATSILSAVPATVARRELEAFVAELGETWGPVQQEVRHLPAHEGPGNVLNVRVDYAAFAEVLTAFGAKGVSAEEVGRRLAHAAKQHLGAANPVGEHLADQLLLPMALAGAGQFFATHASSHLQTNIEVIEKFLPVRFELEMLAQGIRVAVRGGC